MATTAAADSTVGQDHVGAPDPEGSSSSSSSSGSEINNGENLDDSAIDQYEYGVYSNGSQDTATSFDDDDDDEFSCDTSDDDDIEREIFGGKYPSDIHEKYRLMEGVLGEGSFGTVRKCQNKHTKQLRALKTIDKSKLPDATQLRREVDILLDVDHPHIIKLYDVYEDATHIYLVSELCSGGELYDRVVAKTRSKTPGCFSEYGAARIIRNILSAISYCHDEKGIVHRDLKPENFLLTDETDNAQVKVIDFGLSRYSADRMQSCVGTIYYVAPEVLLGEYTSKADIWSIGVVAYVLLCGFPPFNAGTEGLTVNVVKKGHVTFPSPAWDKISTEAKRFVKQLMDKDPALRPSASEAMEDPWVNRDLVKNPFARIWHGTFLSPTSKEFDSVPKNNFVVHHDRNRRDAFAREYSQRQLSKKSQTSSSENKKKRKKKKGWLQSITSSTRSDRNE